MKTKLKQTVAAIFTATLLTTSPAVFADGIPTVDLANIKQGVENFMQDAANHVETIEQWAKQAESMFQQIEHLKTQIQNQLDTLEAIKNVKDLDDAANVLNRLKDVPDEWADMYQSVKDLDPRKALDKLKYDPEMAKKNAMEDLTILNDIQKQFDKNSKNSTFARLQEAEKLLNSANSEIALQKANAMILAEQTKIQQAQFQYDILKAKYEAQEKANYEKKRELHKCYYDNREDMSKCLK